MMLQNAFFFGCFYNTAIRSSYKHWDMLSDSGSPQ